MSVAYRQSGSISISANGTLLLHESAGRLQLHGCFGQATASVEGDIVGTRNTGKSLLHFKFNDREGFVLPFSPEAWARLDIGEDFYVTFTTAAQCYFHLIYSNFYGVD